jgi:hypothetical protein
LTVHSVGMAIMVGIVGVVDLRLAGLFVRIPYTALHRLIGVAWYGLAFNVLTGAALFTSQATSYVSSPVYLTKMLMVLVGVIVAAYMQPKLRRYAADWVGGVPVPAAMRMLAVVSIGIWLLAIVTGRLTAYV